VLNLVPKVEQAIKKSSLRPILFAEIVTGFIDKVISFYNSWTLVGSPDNNASADGNVLAQFRTQIKKENEGTANPTAMLQMFHPAQGGDPVQQATALDISQSAGDVDIAHQRRLPPADPFSTFRVNVGDEDSYQVSRQHCIK